MVDRRLLAAVLLSGFLLDQVFGDPQFLYHPVRLIGRLIQWLEGGIRKLCGQTEWRLFLGGVVLAVTVSGITVFFSWGILALCRMASPGLFYIASVISCYQLLAVKSLKTESMKVYAPLCEDNLLGARKAVSMIVGRDTERLDSEGVIKAAVETVAENTSDGVVAPLFYMAVGGPVLGWFYKAVNTMDSMVGYRNERYLYFGWAAARLDDALNFIPSRLSALFMICAAFFLGMDGKHAWTIWRRDRLNHKSPNSAQTESVCAGALGVQLAGDAWYFGTLHKKKTIGDDLRPVEPEDIKRANRLLYGTACVALAAFLALQAVLAFVW